MIGSPCPRFPPGVVWLLSDILLSGNVHSGLSTVRVRAVRVSVSLYLLFLESFASCLRRLYDI